MLDQGRARVKPPITQELSQPILGEIESGNRVHWVGSSVHAEKNRDGSWDLYDGEEPLGADKKSIQLTRGRGLVLEQRRVLDGRGDKEVSHEMRYTIVSRHPDAHQKLIEFNRPEHSITIADERDLFETAEKLFRAGFNVAVMHVEITADSPSTTMDAVIEVSK